MGTLPQIVYDVSDAMGDTGSYKTPTQLHRKLSSKLSINYLAETILPLMYDAGILDCKEGADGTLTYKWESLSNADLSIVIEGLHDL